MTDARSTPPDREQVIETARKLFAHYGWSNPGDLEMRARIEKMRDMALASIASEIPHMRTALEMIAKWDCLNPPRQDLLHDLPWLRRIVDAALAGKDPRIT